MNSRALHAIESSSVPGAFEDHITSPGTSGLLPARASIFSEGEDILLQSSSSSFKIPFWTTLLSLTLDCVARASHLVLREELFVSVETLFRCSARHCFFEDRSLTQTVRLLPNPVLGNGVGLYCDTTEGPSPVTFVEKTAICSEVYANLTYLVQRFGTCVLTKRTELCLRFLTDLKSLFEELDFTLHFQGIANHKQGFFKLGVSNWPLKTSPIGFESDPVFAHPASEYVDNAAATFLFVPRHTDLLLIYTLCLLFSLYAFILVSTAFGMGNEGSALSGSESSTPLSEYNSMYSLGSRVRSSVESTRAPSPLEPPEPDLSHLTEEEVAKIRAVMDRAKILQEEEQSRVRQLEEEYVNFATKIEREASLTELSDVGGNGVCPICTKNQLPVPPRSPLSPRPALNVCVDCEKLTCSDCGAYHTSVATKLQEWVCTVCERRRKLIMSSGMWYHGYHPETDLPLARKMTNQEQQNLDSVRSAQQQAAMTTSGSSRDSRDSSDSRRSDFSSLSAEINLLTMTSSHNTELARQMYEQSKVKGPGASLPKSESDDFSDLASDLDFDEIASERSRPDGSSTEEISRDFCVISHPGQTSQSQIAGAYNNGSQRSGDRRPKHRPRSLNLSRSHSSTSDEDGEGDKEGDETGDKSGEEGLGKTTGGGGGELSAMGALCGADRKDKRKEDRAGSYRKDGSDTSSRTSSESYYGANTVSHQHQQRGSSGSAHQHAYSHGPMVHHSSQPSSSHLHAGSLNQLRDPNSIMPSEFVEANKVNSPTPPRSPSWREGLESPPFSPRRRDSYPGKRSRGSPVSPKDSKFQFSYGDISPPSRQLSLEEMCDMQLGASGGYDGGGFGHMSMSAMSHKLSPKSPEESHDSFTSTTGQILSFEMPPTRGAKTGSSTLATFCGGDVGFSSKPMPSSSSSDYHQSEMLGLPHSVPLMDLATYAATVANSTACLTSMSVSPTAILPHSTTGLNPHHTEPLSPDSVDSTDSTSSPVSPGYYDNASSTSEDLEEMDLADPSAKSIDMGSAKRQKARPPSTDWSPVIDLSPILDVSPSVEEAEQEDMLAKQREELQRQRSREESDMDRDEDDEEDDDVTMYSMSNSMSSSQDQNDVITNPFAFKSERRSGEDNSDGQELMEFSSFSSLRRYDNLEDISQIGASALPEDEEARIYRVATEAAGAAIAAALEEHRRMAMIHEDENGNPPSPDDDAPFPSCITQAQPAATTGSNPVTTGSSIPGRMLETSSGGATQVGPEEEARSQRKALEAHISDEISKITQGMQDIVRRGAADIKPIPPPKPRRRLPEPTPEMTAAATASAVPVPFAMTTSGPTSMPLAVSPSLKRARAANQGKGLRTMDKKEEISQTVRTSPIPAKGGDVSHKREIPFQSSSSTSDSESQSMARQDSGEKRKAKDLKAKPSPLLIQHIEAEEQSVSPHYRVMDSPPTPENKLIKREFSESTSVSPSSSPDNDQYMFPSPVTPPDSDSSPPKPHSPSSAGTDLDEDTLQYSSTGDLQMAVEGSGSGENIAETYETYADPPPFVKSLSQTEMKPPSKRIPPPVPARSKASGAAGGVEGPRALPPPPVRRSESIESEVGSEDGEATASVRDKIRAFEQFASKPKQEKIEARREPRKDLLKKDPKSTPVKDEKDKNNKEKVNVPAATTTTVVTTTTASPSSVNANNGKEGKKVRRKLPPIPAGEDPVLTPRSKVKRPKVPTRKQDPTPRQPSPSVLPRREQSPSPIKRQQQQQQQQQRQQQQQYLHQQQQQQQQEQNRQHDIIQQQKREVSPQRRSPQPPQPQIQIQQQILQHPLLRQQQVQQRPTPAQYQQQHQPQNLQSGSLRASEIPLNDEDLEVAQINTGSSKIQQLQQVEHDKRKKPLADLMKSKSLESSEPTRAREKVKPMAQHTPSHTLHRASSLGSSVGSTLGSCAKNETDEIIDALINIYGIPITEAMKSLKKRLQEELRRVTRDRKRKLEELEEIRALQMQIGALKLEGDAYRLARHVAAVTAERDKRGPSYVNITVEPKKALTPRSSPQVTPRRQRHKRQSSDPMISKFSPIKEDKDIEADFQAKMEPVDVRGSSGMLMSRYSTDDSSQSGLSDSESTRSEPATGSARYKASSASNYAKMYYPVRASSSERLQPDHSLGPAPLSGSRSEQHLAVGHRSGRSSGSRTPTYYSDDEEKCREEKKAQLQYEIQKRKQQLEETARLKKELLKLARARQAIAHSYDDIPRQYGAPVVPGHTGGGSAGNLALSPRPVPRGIIRPIDDDLRIAELERERERLERACLERDELDQIYDVLPARVGRGPLVARASMVVPPERGGSDRGTLERGGGVPLPYPTRSNFSATEYLAHKQEIHRRQRVDEPLYVNTATAAGWVYDRDLPGGPVVPGSLQGDPVPMPAQPPISKRIDSLPSVQGPASTTARDERDPHLTGSVTLPDIYSNRCDLDFRPPHPVQACLSGSNGYVNTSISDTDGSPTSVSDVTPAMPLLDDVKDKSRKIIHNIGSGSRPVSAEFNIGDVEDLMNGMYRVESDNSVDADEPIMKHMTEGGVTILKQMERKRRPPPPEPTRYGFPVKRILVTRDPKDRSVAGNGIGMKIVGGKEIPGTSETGAFVTAIYPGLIADQLHGELEVGDQVLEWNGVTLTGKTYEDVQQIITQTNGEIELVVRASNPSVSVDAAAVGRQAESCHSSYDNLPAYDDMVKEMRVGSTGARSGVDPRLLAAQLEEIQETSSPADHTESPSSSQQGPPTPSMSSPCSTPRSDPTSTSSDKQRPSGGRHTPDRRDRDNKKGDEGKGSGGGSGSSGGERHHRRSTRHHRDSDRDRERDGKEPRDRERESHESRERGERERERSRMRDRADSSSSKGRGSRDRDRDRERDRDSSDRDRDRRYKDTASDSTPTPTNAHHHHHHRSQPQLLSDGSEDSALPPSSTGTSTGSSIAAAVAAAPATTSAPTNPSIGTATSSSADMQSNERRRNTAPASPELAPRSRTPSKKNKASAKEAAKKAAESIAKAPVIIRPEDKGLGAIQLQLSHDDYDSTLNVHVIQAVNLRPRDINGLSDPFTKVYLLPGRGPENKRRTKHIARTLNPEWHQTLVFQDIARGELQNKVLELTVWDYDRFKANDFLGELILELSEFGFLDNKPHWYPLREHVVIQSFELPKSSVPPPLSSGGSDSGKVKGKSPRHAKRGSASPRIGGNNSSTENDLGPRRRSLGTLVDSCDPRATSPTSSDRERITRQVASATSSPTPRRKPRESKSPIKTRSNDGLDDAEYSYIDFKCV